MDDAERAAVEVCERVRVMQPRERVGDDARADDRLEGRVALLTSAHDAVERLPLQILHRDVVDAFVLPHLVGVDDVRMVQARGQSGLVQKHRAKALVVGETRAEALDDGELVEAHRPARQREEDLGHPTAPEDGEELVFP